MYSPSWVDVYKLDAAPWRMVTSALLVPCTLKPRSMPKASITTQLDELGWDDTSAPNISSSNNRRITL